MAFDWDALNDSEEHSLGFKEPTIFIFGGRTVKVAQQRLPDDNQPENTGSQVWPATLALSQYLEEATLGLKGTENHIPDGRVVLELGAGTGLVGLCAHALGAKKVLLTDVPSVLPGIARNVELNTSAVQGSVQVAGLDWRDVADGKGLPLDEFDIILGSDIVLWPELFEPLCTALTRLAAPKTSILLSIEHRSKEISKFFETLAQSFEVVEMDSSATVKAQNMGNNVRIYHARRA